MKISDLAFFNTLADSIDTVSSNLGIAQQQLATGKRVLQPSDDPAAFAEAGLLQAAKSASNNDVALAAQVQGRLNATDGALAQAANAIAAAMASATEGADGTVNAAQMATIGQTVQGQLAELIQSANLDYGGIYVFSGDQTQVAPFSSAGVYAGDTGGNSAVFSNGTSLQATFNGQAVFGDSTTGAIGALQSLVTALNAGDKVGTAAALPQLSAALQQISNTRASIGASLNIATSLVADQNANIVALDNNLNQLVNADLAKTAAAIQEQMTQLQAVVAFASDMARIPLVNILA